MEGRAAQAVCVPSWGSPRPSQARPAPAPLGAIRRPVRAPLCKQAFLCRASWLRQSGMRLLKKRQYLFFNKAALRSAPRLTASGGQFDARFARSVFFRHRSVANRPAACLQRRPQRLCREDARFRPPGKTDFTLFASADANPARLFDKRTEGLRRGGALPYSLSRNLIYYQYEKPLQGQADAPSRSGQTQARPRRQQAGGSPLQSPELIRRVSPSRPAG